MPGMNHLRSKEAFWMFTKVSPDCALNPLTARQRTAGNKRLAYSMHCTYRYHGTFCYFRDAINLILAFRYERNNHGELPQDWVPPFKHVRDEGYAVIITMMLACGVIEWGRKIDRVLIIILNRMKGKHKIFLSQPSAIIEFRSKAERKRM